MEHLPDILIASSRPEWSGAETGDYAMSICSEFRELVETIVEDLEELLEDTCLSGPFDISEGEARTPVPGDIIGVDRGMYQHYGIYAGDNRVIHYTADTSDLDPENAEIQETSLERFLRDDAEYFILEPGESSGGLLDMFLSSALSNAKEAGKRARRDEHDTPPAFAPEETLKRARSRIGEREYNLLTNNCEHFVVWCKTGISESRQVRHWATLCQRVFLNAGLVPDYDEA